VPARPVSRGTTTASSAARTFNGRPWRHVVLFLHPVDRDAPAILQQGFNTAQPEGAIKQPTRSTHLNVARVSGIRASGPLVIGVSLLGTIKRGRQSLRHDLFGLDLVRDISLWVLLFLATGGSGLARRRRKKINLLIHTSLEVSCTRVMPRTTRYQRHIDNSTKHPQL
jgi:hypothetical protein